MASRKINLYNYEFFATKEGGSLLSERGRSRKWIKRRNESGILKLAEELRVEDSVAYNEVCRMNYKAFLESSDILVFGRSPCQRVKRRINCETFEELFTAIGPVIT